MTEPSEAAGDVGQPSHLRRAMVQGGVALGLIAAAGPRRAAAQGAGAGVIVETSKGKVRGANQGPLRVFKGIPYGASTAGANRFRPPQPVAAWTGVRDALVYGGTAPQLRDSAANAPPMSEDCLYLNVWTLAPAGALKPVMVWIHGGAWGGGSGSSRGQDGTRLAQDGDVVVVSINHRLGVFGYIKLETTDARFADSGNAGVLDMVEALRWVRDNIAAFGGDPGNVTIFGHSGGGAKVSALTATAAAQGLFHKAIAQSCSGTLRINEPKESTLHARAVAQHLGLAAATPALLQALPMAQLIPESSNDFVPIVDGRTFTRHPYDPDAPAVSRNIPFMAGNAATETGHHLAVEHENLTSLSEAEVEMRLARFWKIRPAEVKKIYAIYAKADPAMSPSHILMTITTDYEYILPTRREVALRTAAGGAPSYAYVFNWETPLEGGIEHSPHGVELPFVFGAANAALRAAMPAADVDRLTKMMISTWTTFARTGNPNNPTLPNWPRYDARDRSVMVLNLTSHVERDPGGEARASLDRLPVFQYTTKLNYTRHGAIPPGKLF